MFLAIAWRNIWRNPRRSTVLISAVAMGVFSFLGLSTYMAGFSAQWIDASIRHEGGHVLVAGAGYYANPVIRNSIPDSRAIVEAVGAIDGSRYLSRLEAAGILNSAAQAAAIQLAGVNPALERQSSPIPSVIVDGTYLEEPGDGLVMGAVLAEKLNIRLGERVVLLVNDLDNELASVAVRVAGLYESASRAVDERVVFMHRRDIQELIGFGEHEVSSVSVFLDDGQRADEVVTQLQINLSDPGLELLTWRDRMPLIVSMESMLALVGVLVATILFAAIGFTLINSFLMVIYERIRELGIMMANGVSPGQVRRMIWLEAGFMVLLGTVIGIGLATALISWWSQVGLDLSAFSEGLRSFGADTVVYPRLERASVISGSLTVIVMIALAVAWPAWKASRFRVVDALQHT